MMHAVVESLAGTGWDRHVWDRAGQVQPRCGVAATLDEAKAQAQSDRTLAELLTTPADRVGDAEQRRGPASIAMSR